MCDDGCEQKVEWLREDLEHARKAISHLVAVGSKAHLEGPCDHCDAQKWLMEHFG